MTYAEAILLGNHMTYYDEVMRGLRALDESQIEEVRRKVEEYLLVYEEEKKCQK